MMKLPFSAIAVFLMTFQILAPTGALFDGDSVLVENNESFSNNIQKKNYGNVCIDVGVHEDGYYRLMGDVEIEYNKDDVSAISIDDPALLAFQVSSLFDGGVWLLDLEKGQEMLNNLTEVSEALKNSGNDDLSAKVNEMIDTLSDSGPITQAST